MPRDYIDQRNFAFLGYCPCGKQIHASTDPPSVMHGVPWCAAFEALEPDEFLAYVRRSRGISDAEANAVEVKT